MAVMAQLLLMQYACQALGMGATHPMPSCWHGFFQQLLARSLMGALPPKGGGTIAALGGPIRPRNPKAKRPSHSVGQPNRDVPGSS